MTVIKRVIRTAWNGFMRHGWLSLVASFIMAQALIIVTFFLVVNVVTGSVIDNLNQKLDLAIYFNDTASEQQITSLQDRLSGDERVDNTVYISKEDARERFLDQNRSNQRLSDIISEGENFLPASLEVKVTDPSEIEAVSETVTSGNFASIVSKTSYADNQELISRLQSFSDFVRTMSLWLGLLFGAIALLIIFNTIRITIFARSREIEIMKLVGATDWYIRWPFLLEGVFYGIGATIISVAVMAGLYFVLIEPLATGFLTGSVSLSSVFTPLFIARIIGLQLIIGLGVGVLSSYLATRNYLKI